MSKRLTIEFVRAEFEKEGYELLSTVYVNAHTKLSFKCSQGHIHSITWNDFKNGNRCFYCSKKVKPTIEFIKKEFEKRGYKLLSKVYLSNKNELNFICSKGHNHSMTWSDFKRGNNCGKCHPKI